MADKKSNSHISIANILALIGLAGIGVITFFGVLMHSSDGKPGAAIIVAIAVTAVLAFLLWFAIKAKGSEESPEKWRIVMWVCVVLYVGVAALDSFPFCRFFYVVEHKSELRELALSEVDAIRSMHASYEHQRRSALQNAREQFQNYVDSRQKDARLSAYIADKHISTPQGLAAWVDKAESITRLPERDPEFDRIKSDIEVWNYITLPDLARRLEEFDSEALVRLQDRIGKYRASAGLIPVVENTADGHYFLNGEYQFDLGSSPEPLFAEKLRSADGSTLLGWILFVLLNGLVLLHLAVAPSSKVVPRRNADIGGRKL